MKPEKTGGGALPVFQIDLPVAWATGQLWTRFWISSKNQSKHRLNHSIWKRSPNPHFGHHHWSSHIGSYSESFMILCSDMDSPQKNWSRHKSNLSIQRRSPNPHFSHHHWSSHIWSYSENLMILWSDMDSPQKTGLDTSQTIPFGGGHPILISHHHWSSHIESCSENFMFLYSDLDSPGKWVQIQVEPSRMEVKPSVFHQYFAFSSPIRKGTNLGPLVLESPQESAPGDC